MRARWHQVQQTLRLSAEQFRSVVEDRTELICQFKADGTLTFINDVYCELVSIYTI
ncbi:MAG: hypothetical protein KKE37_05375 [Verrucomicrobia bacterium]|nr:hypothetical protein [Verrucomicrobiota bacterium]MBU4292195.1 hypothetical protein [Verrucomicrobiota bacterium]MBU4428769.1 hypothetical protein [Verrucomicrobiota bacterium]MCG2681639.1 hypothetical protein [Kiritimatiellia bacterium]